MPSSSSRGVVHRHIDRGSFLLPRTRSKSNAKLFGSVIVLSLWILSALLGRRSLSQHHGTALPAICLDHLNLVILSAFNALTLTRRLPRLLPPPRKESLGLLGKCLNGQSRFPNAASKGYVRRSAGYSEERSGAGVDCGFRSWLEFFLACRVPSSFLPMKTKGYVYITWPFRTRLSLERTTRAASGPRRSLASTPASEYTTSVVWFSLLRFVRTTTTGFCFRHT